jgi:CheY-like chemotaxis protein
MQDLSGIAPARLDVLIVDDNPPDVYLLKMAIHQEYPFCDFHVVGTGEEAFRFLLRDGPWADAVTPDIVVLDLNLPLRGGEEVLDLIRMTDRLRNIVVVLCSSSPRDPRFRSPVGPDACLTKPANLDAYLALGKEIMACYWCRKGMEPAA